ncbi:hypothetical protein EDF62_1247 [Leucobacter luti]|uniref:Uncharacterized protein n=1 Tax=Leucobacter luti TaxID=340320 RepID=A0A4V3CY93_9MICO|nr:hypothetical protein EDF62_1247 [Leucobacter luti]
MMPASSRADASFVAGRCQLRRTLMDTGLHSKSARRGLQAAPGALVWDAGD